MRRNQNAVWGRGNYISNHAGPNAGDGVSKDKGRVNTQRHRKDKSENRMWGHNEDSGEDGGGGVGKSILGATWAAWSTNTQHRTARGEQRATTQSMERGRATQTIGGRQPENWIGGDQPGQLAGDNPIIASPFCLPSWSFLVPLSPSLFLSLARGFQFVNLFDVLFLFSSFGCACFIFAIFMM